MHYKTNSIIHHRINRDNTSTPCRISGKMRRQTTTKTQAVHTMLRLSAQAQSSIKIHAVNYLQQWKTNKQHAVPTPIEGFQPTEGTCQLPDISLPSNGTHQYDNKNSKCRFNISSLQYRLSTYSAR